MSILRRSFLKIGTAIVGGLTIAKYIEPMEKIENTYKDWIEERNGFYIVRVPDFKTFEKEHLNMPTIFLMGQNSALRNCQIDGYANIDANSNSINVSDVYFDTRKLIVPNHRPVLLVSRLNVSRIRNVVGAI